MADDPQDFKSRYRTVATEAPGVGPGLLFIRWSCF